MAFSIAKNRVSFYKIILAIIILFFSFTLLIVDSPKVQALGVSGMSLSGTGITNNSSPISTNITPTITFTLGTNVPLGQPITISLRGMVTVSSLDQSQITLSGGCSGSPVITNNPLPSGVQNPSLNIIGITCTTSVASISIAAGKLASRLTAANYEIEIFTQNDYGYFYYYVGGENQVSVTAKINSIITIKVYPEKRIPTTNHWMNQNVVEIRSVGSTIPLVTQTVNMDAAGIGTMSSVDSSLVPGGTYDFGIKGYSHLRKIYTANLNANTIFLDFTGPGTELLAGDTSVIEDNYVNSLDLSTISSYLYSGNVKNDLNRDTVVNSLDLSNMSTNLYLKGQD